MNAQLILIFDNLGHRFGERRLFAGFSAQFVTGDVVAVVGPNGAGKSTLLRLTAGLLRPTSGDIKLEANGARLEPQAVQRAVGLAAPDIWPYRALTVAENLAFFARLRGVSDTAPTAQSLGLAERLNQPAGELSSGYVQRLRLALAVLHEPALLLLDEPSANLDEAGHRALAGLIAAQRQRGICLLAAHDPRDITHGNRVIELAG